MMSADRLSLGQRAIIYAILLCASLAYNYNFVLVDYVRPFLVRHGGMTLSDTALLYSAQGSGVILGSFVSPVLVGRFGSKPVLVAGAFALTLFTAVNDLVVAFAPWLIVRFLVGLGLTAIYVASITMLANFFPPRARGRLLSLNMAMFSVALLSVGALGALVGEEEWRRLVQVGAVAPLLVAVLAWVGLPDDRRFQVYADAETSDASNEEQGRWREMLRGPRLRLTLACLLLAGLNFSAYQFYSGFITTYLMEVRRFDPQLTGLFVVVDGVGTLLGSLMWGWLADRYGRRTNAIGFALAAMFTLAFLVAPVSTPVLLGLELGYAICLSCTNVWAAYFAELFPVRLRPQGTSLFHGGHIISLSAPLIVTAVAAHAGLAAGMALAPATFAIGALIWWRLPETLRTSRLYRGFDAEAGGVRPAPPAG